MAKSKRPFQSLVYTCAMAFVLVLFLWLQVLPQLIQDMSGLLSLLALGYGLTDAGLVTLHTVVRRPRARG